MLIICVYLDKVYNVEACWSSVCGKVYNMETCWSSACDKVYYTENIEKFLQ